MIISEGNSRKAVDWIPIDITWPRLCERLSKTTYTDETEEQYQAMSKDEKTRTKDVGGFVGGELKDGKRKKENLVSREILALDIDYGTPDTWDDYQLMCDWTCFMHTTHSSTHSHPRYRMYFPLTRAVNAQEYEAIGRKVAELIGIEMFDSTTYQPGRLMFWPSTCKDGWFQYWPEKPQWDKGEWINPDEVLGMYKNWRDIGEWARSGRETQIIRQAEPGEKQQDPRTKTGLVGAFCKIHDIHSAIETYLSDVYKPCEESNRYTYTGGSTYGGLVLYDDGLFCYSWHESDPIHGRMCNAYDLVRLHWFPGMEEKESHAAMKNLVREKDEEVWLLLNEMQGMETDLMFTGDNDTDAAMLARLRTDLTESGNAIKLRDKYHDVMCFSPSLGWCMWDGRVWRTSDEAKAVIKVMSMNDEMLTQAEQMLASAPKEDPTRKKADQDPKLLLAKDYYAWAIRSRSSTIIDHTLSKAKALMSVSGEFDFDPWMLNTPECMVDLKTGELKRFDPNQRCTKTTAITPEFNKPHPLWDEFLDQLTAGDKEYQKYLQDVAGMACVGKVYEECLVIVYGAGNNGKSTFFQIWSDLLGDYAGTVRNEVLVGNRFGTEVAGADQLRGMRLVVTSELDEAVKLSGSLMKRLTSRDKISANVKYKAPITFTPSHTLILHTNHLPRLESVDNGTKRRITIAPFNNVIPADRKIMNFADVLVEKEGPAILAWMIEGAVRFYRNGMKIKKPDIIETASTQYVMSEDKVSRFIDECCSRGDKEYCYSQTLYSKFQEWLKQEGLYWTGGAVSFKRRVEQIDGVTCTRSNKGIKVVGVGLDPFKGEGDEDLL